LQLIYIDRNGGHKLIGVWSENLSKDQVHTFAHPAIRRRLDRTVGSEQRGCGKKKKKKRIRYRVTREIGTSRETLSVLGLYRLSVGKFGCAETGTTKQLRSEPYERTESPRLGHTHFHVSRHRPRFPQGNAITKTIAKLRARGNYVAE